MSNRFGLPHLPLAMPTSFLCISFMVPWAAFFYLTERETETENREAEHRAWTLTAQGPQCL